MPCHPKPCSRPVNMCLIACSCPFRCSIFSICSPSLHRLFLKFNCEIQSIWRVFKWDDSAILYFVRKRTISPKTDPLSLLCHWLDRHQRPSHLCLSRLNRRKVAFGIALHHCPSRRRVNSKNDLCASLVLSDSNGLPNGLDTETRQCMTSLHQTVLNPISVLNCVPGSDPILVIFIFMSILRLFLNPFCISVAPIATLSFVNSGIDRELTHRRTTQHRNASALCRLGCSCADCCGGSCLAACSHERSAHKSVLQSFDHQSASQLVSVYYVYS